MQSAFKSFLFCFFNGSIFIFLVCFNQLNNIASKAVKTPNVITIPTPPAMLSANDMHPITHTHTHTPQSNRGQAPCVALADAQPQQARNNRTCYSSLSVNPYRSALARSPITPPQTCPACHPCRQGRLSRCVCSVSNPGPLKWSSFSRAGLIVFLQH